MISIHPPALLDVENYKNLDELIQKATPVVLVKKGKEVVVEPIKKGLFTKPIGTVDVIVPIMHGTNGEDGTIQGYLEMLKIPYAGCDVIGAAVGQDKVVMSIFCRTAGCRSALGSGCMAMNSRRSRKQS